MTINGVDYTVAGVSSATSACVDLSACNTVDYGNIMVLRNSGITDTWSVLAEGLDADFLVICSSGCSDSTAVNFNPDADLVIGCEYPAAMPLAIF